MQKMKPTKENRKHDGNFKKKNISHDPQTESSKVIFGKEGNVHNES